MHSTVDEEMEQARNQAITVAADMEKAADKRSDELTNLTHRSILVTWLVLGLGLVGSFAVASYFLQTDVVQELWTIRDSIQALAVGELDRPIPFVNRPNEIGAIGRSLHTLQGGARDRETQSWVKAEVAAAAVRLQSAKDFGTFPSTLLSRLSEAIPLLYAAFYLADNSRSRVDRVGTFALNGAPDSASFALGEALVGQAALEKRTFVVKARVRSHIMVREARAQLAAQLLALNNELEMARQIQLSILPHSLPHLPGLDIAARFSRMTSVAGDFHDFIQVDDTHLGILIADVSGHGLPSALIASMLQVALTGQAHHAAKPAEVLAGLNRALCGKFTHNFVTAAYVYLDLEKQLMRYAGAGHPPVLQWRNSTGSTSKVLG